MAKFVAFLRAINVGGRVVKMDRLRAIFETLGFANVETFIASGNVIFETTDPSALEARIASQLKASLHYDVDVFVRSDRELAAVAAHNPFNDADMKTARALNVAFIGKPLDPRALEILRRFVTEVDDFRAQDREVYWLCRLKQSESAFSNAAFERALGIRATFRGLNTVNRIAARWCGTAEGGRR